MKGECNSCGLCVAGCVAFQATGDESMTAQARHQALQARLPLEELSENLDHCVQSGYCTAVCPLEIDNDQLFLDLRKSQPSNHRELFSRHWQSSKNLYGQPLSSLSRRRHPEHSRGISTYLHLGCTFRKQFANDLPLLEKTLNRLQLNWSWFENEPCCGAFLDAVGAGGDVEKTSFAAFLDAGCGSSIPQAKYLWDELLIHPEHFVSLQGRSLFVSSAWLNSDPRARLPLIRHFCAATGAQTVNLDSLGAAVGHPSSDWRSRLGLEIPFAFETLEDVIVMEPAHRCSKNRWLLEFLR